MTEQQQKMYPLVFHLVLVEFHFVFIDDSHCYSALGKRESRLDQRATKDTNVRERVQIQSRWTADGELNDARISSE